MSPWWREEISVHLAPASVTLVRRSRGPRRRELEGQKLTSSAAGGWPDMVAAMSAYLEARQWRNADLCVTLHGNLVHYLVLPHVEELSDRDALLFAEQSFANRYGETARGWSVCLSVAGRGKPRIAAAVDRQLIEALQTNAGMLGQKLRSVRPALSAAVQNLAHVDSGFSGWLAVMDAGHSCLARMHKGECMSVRTARFAESAEQHLLAQLEQDALCAGLDAAAGKLYVHAASPLDTAPLKAHGWHAALLPAGGLA